MNLSTFSFSFFSMNFTTFFIFMNFSTFFLFFLNLHKLHHLFLVYWLTFFFCLRRTSPPLFCSFSFFSMNFTTLFFLSPFFFIYFFYLHKLHYLFLVYWLTCYLGLVGGLLLSSHPYYSALTHSVDTQACSTVTQSASWSE